MLISYAGNIAATRMLWPPGVTYLLRGVPRNDDWKVFLEILRNKPGLRVKPEEVVTKLVA